MKRLILLIFALLYTINVSLAQVNKITIETKSPKQYEKVEIDINLVSQWDNPYLQNDIALDMHIVAPSGKQLTLPCYFESGRSGEISLWKARFTPQEIGKYKFQYVITENRKAVSTSKEESFTAKASKRNGFLHPKDNWTLVYDNGTSFRGIGENICWESRANDDSKFFKDLHETSKYSYDYMLPDFAKNGGNFYRTWMCTWNLPIDRKDNFNNNRYSASEEFYNPSAVARFDKMIEIAEANNLYIMLVLGMGSSSVKDGGFATSNADFFVNPKSAERYKDRMRYIIARWGYSTSIGAWELFNEIDNVQFGDTKNPIDAKHIVDWHDQMSTFIKDTDPYKHIITTSISHRDLKGLNSLKNIDINQKHIYRNTSIIPAEITKYEMEFGKPYVIGEFGYEWDWSKNFDDFAEDMDIDFKRGLWYGLFSPTPITPMSWWWEFFDNRDMTPYFRGVRKINDQMLSDGKGSFEALKINADKLDAFSVKCGKRIYVYLYNGTPSTITTDAIIGAQIGQYSVVSFEPTSMKSAKLALSTQSPGSINIAGITLGSKREMVYILTPKK